MPSSYSFIVKSYFQTLISHHTFGVRINNDLVFMPLISPYGEQHNTNYYGVIILNRHTFIIKVIHTQGQNK